MIFSELYSVYYTAVAKILTAALQTSATEADLQRIVREHAFAESVLTILPALKKGVWPLLTKELSPVLSHAPTMPLTLLEKQWLKAICEDPRVKLFGAALPELPEVEPLFTRESYRIFDQYADGDPFEDEAYIRHFRLLLTAIREKRPVFIAMRNRFGAEIRLRMLPVGLEYSLKDDKFRVLARECRYRQFNLGRILRCAYAPEGEIPPVVSPPEEKILLTLEILDEHNALERVMLHFSHFEKQCERLTDNRYRLQLTYDRSDEPELVIRMLAFGPRVQVIGPAHMVSLLQQRLTTQQKLGPC